MTPSLLKRIQQAKPIPSEDIFMMKSFFKSPNTQSKDDPYEIQVTAQAVDFIYHTILRVPHLLNLMPIALLLVMWGKTNHALLIAWCSVVIIVNEAFTLQAKVYTRRNPAQKDARRWGRYYTLYGLANSLLWGAASILFFLPDSIFHQVFIYALIIGITAGSISLSAYWIESYYALIFPMVSMVILRLLMEGGVENLVLAAQFMMMMVVFITVAQSTRKSVLAAIRLRFENLDLVERLREEKERAEMASRDKTRFLASASHDLRQPVHALILFSDALAGEVHSSKGKELLSNVDRSVDALNQLLSSLLDISKLDANIVKPNLEHFTLKTMCDSLHKEYALQIQEKGLALHVRIEDDLIAHSDPILFGTMLRNLISNAIRYTDTGSIVINCVRLGSEVRIDVYDSGIGIPPEQHREIFREFYQLTNPERDRSKGLGLGLAIIDRLATLLHHRIELQSEVGKGSRFSIILPAGDPVAVVSLQTQHMRTGYFDTFGMRIVVIDGEQAVRDGMQAVLKNWGCVTILAGSEEEALEKLKDGAPPHIIIADYRLRDGKTGAQAIARLRSEFGKEIPALIITGDTDPNRLRDAEASGHTLMHKPVQIARLHTYLRHIAKRKGLMYQPI